MMNDIKADSVLAEVLQERYKQNQKWGEQNHDLTTWVAILGEEFGEVAKEAVDFCCENPPSSDEQDLAETALRYLRLQRYRKELIQTAAVAVQMIESLDRNELANY